MGGKRLTQTQKDEMLCRFEAGESKKSIANALNLPHDTVVRNTPKRLHRSHVTKALHEQMCRLVESGKSKLEVARSLGLAGSTVAKHTSHIDRRRRRISAEMRSAAIAQGLAGESAPSIALSLGLSRASVTMLTRQALREYQLTEVEKAGIQTAKREGWVPERTASNLAIPFLVVRRIYHANTYPVEVRQAAIRAMEAGESAAAVAARLGIRSGATVWQWFSNAIKRGDAQEPQKYPEMRDDLQFAWITRLSAELEEWRKLIVGWFHGGKKVGTAQAVTAVAKFVKGYLVAGRLPMRPADLLQRGRLLPDFYKFACPTGRTGRRYNSAIFELIEWVLDSPGFADTDGAEPIRITDLYRNPINWHAGSDDAVQPPTESNKVVLPYFLIVDLRKRIVQGPNFGDWTLTQGLGGVSTINGRMKAGDWFVVTEDRIDRDDPDCVWRVRRHKGKQPLFEMWSPVRWVHALLHLQTTTRGGQARMLDSGEADTFIWKDGRFIPNPGLLRQGTTRKLRQQGVFRRPSPEDSAQGAVICLYFNNNKTADRGKVGANKGFECHWPQAANVEEDPYCWLVKLRDWQMKYNPIKSLTPWRELKGLAKLSIKTDEEADEYPDTAFLFRAAEDRDHPAWPINSGVCYLAWQKLLTAYEVILAKEGIKHPSGEPIQLINQENGAAWSSPHATRTSLITHLILDGDVPPAVMMKIAGHARFIMTIYYTKVGILGIQNAIKAATERIEATKYQTFERDLLSARAEQMRDKVVFNAEDWPTVIPSSPAERTPLGWMHMHDGICLAGGNTSGDPSTPGCHNGSLVSSPRGGGRVQHGPVPGGIRNCCRCRWKAAGKQHILGLAATFDNRAYHMHITKDRAIAAERQRNRFMQDKARVESANQPYTRMRELIDADRSHEMAMQKFQELALDVAALHRTIERVMALPDNVDGSTVMATQGDFMTLNQVVEDTESKLLQLATVCADIELFPDLEPGPAIFEFAELLDNAFEREGQPMILARLSEKEKLAAANAIMRELERKANPDNQFIGRRAAVEIMDRGDSLEKMLGVKLEDILHSQIAVASRRLSWPLKIGNAEESGNDE